MYVINTGFLGFLDTWVFSGTSLSLSLSLSIYIYIYIYMKMFHNQRWITGLPIQPISSRPKKGIQRTEIKEDTGLTLFQRAYTLHYIAYNTIFKHTKFIALDTSHLSRACWYTAESFVALDGGTIFSFVIL